MISLELGMLIRSDITVWLFRIGNLNGLKSL